jgi:hypothetical protein
MSDANRDHTQPTFGLYGHKKMEDSQAKPQERILW